MRGNSGFLRWLPCKSASTSPSSPSTSFCSITSIRLQRFTAFATVILLLAATSAHAGPASRHRRMIETNTEKDTQIDEETCIFNGTDVPKRLIHCEFISGCRPIKKTGHCCPEYQCACERNGTTYQHREKIVEPERPCDVCHCQGGEIICNRVACYVRNDCEPKYVEGVCCPQYEGCPPLDLRSTTANSEYVSTAETTVKLTLATTPKPPLPNPLGISIKEITKGEEIRITEDKPKTTYRIKPHETPNLKDISGTPLNQVESRETNQPSEEIPPEVMQHNSLAETQLPSDGVSTTETVNKLENSDVNSISDNNGSKAVRHTDQQAADDQIGNDAINKSRTNDVQSDEKIILFVENGQTKPITVYEASGLQQGDILEEVTEYEDKKPGAKRSGSHTAQVEPHSVESEVIYENTSRDKTVDYDGKAVSDFDPIASSSDDFIRILISTKRSDIQSSDPTTEGVHGYLTGEADLNMSTSGADSFLNERNETDLNLDVGPIETDEDAGNNLNITTEGPNTFYESHSIPFHHGFHPHTLEYDDTTLHEVNPAYPNLPSDLSVYQHYAAQPFEEESESLKEDGKMFHSESRINDSSPLTEGPDSGMSAEWLRFDNSSSTTEKEFNVTEISSSAPLIQERSPGEPFLVPEWERNSTQMERNDTEDGVIFSSYPGSESIDADEFSGSGQGQLITKDRESTTSRISTIADIDDVEGSAGSSEAPISLLMSESLKHDPKEDAESLKYDEEAGSSIAVSNHQRFVIKSILTN